MLALTVLCVPYSQVEQQGQNVEEGPAVDKWDRLDMEDPDEGMHVSLGEVHPPTP